MKDQKRWASIVERWEASGVAPSMFCKRERLKLATFYRKRAQLEKLAPVEPRFVEVSSSGESPMMELVGTNGVRVRLPMNTSCDRISELAQCLG